MLTSYRCLLSGLKKKAETLPTYTWDEISKHTGSTDKWIVIEGLVYDVSTWMKRHPGGAKIISHFGGQDTTVIPYSFWMNTINL